LQLQPPHNPPKKVAGTAKDRPPNSRKGSDAKVNDAKVNDAKVNDAKVNDAKVNDRKVNDRKVNDHQVNDQRVNDRQDGDVKANAPTVNVLQALRAVGAKVKDASRADRVWAGKACSAVAGRKVADSAACFLTRCWLQSIKTVTVNCRKKKLTAPSSP
jgi:hypothetical protein